MICTARPYFHQPIAGRIPIRLPQELFPKFDDYSCVAHEVGMTAVAMLSRCGNRGCETRRTPICGITQSNGSGLLRASSSAGFAANQRLVLRLLQFPARLFRLVLGRSDTPQVGRAAPICCLNLVNGCDAYSRRPTRLVSDYYPCHARRIDPQTCEHK
jgi:hypothetical protein